MAAAVEPELLERAVVAVDDADEVAVDVDLRLLRLDLQAQRSVVAVGLADRVSAAATAAGVAVVTGVASPVSVAAKERVVVEIAEAEAVAGAPESPRVVRIVRVGRVDRVVAARRRLMAVPSRARWLRPSPGDRRADGCKRDRSTGRAGLVGAGGCRRRTIRRGVAAAARGRCCRRRAALPFRCCCRRRASVPPDRPIAVAPQTTKTAQRSSREEGEDQPEPIPESPTRTAAAAAARRRSIRRPRRFAEPPSRRRRRYGARPSPSYSRSTFAPAPRRPAKGADRPPRT